MASRSSSRGQQQAEEGTKRTDEMIIIKVDEVVDVEPPSAPPTRSTTTPNVAAPATPYLTPLPLTHLPLPTIETMLTYPTLPQPLYDSLLRGEPPAKNYNTVLRAPLSSHPPTDPLARPHSRDRTDSESSNSTISEAASEQGKEEFHSAYEEFPFPSPPSLSPPTLSIDTFSSQTLTHSFSDFSLHEDKLGGGPLYDDDAMDYGSLGGCHIGGIQDGLGVYEEDVYGDNGVIYGAAGLAMSPRTMKARRESGFWAMASGFDGVGTLERILEDPREGEEGMVK